jgi:hypothetical protein
MHEGKTMSMNRVYGLVLVNGLLVFTGCDWKPKDTNSNSKEPDKVTIGDVKRDAATSMKTTAEYSQQNKDKIVKDLKEQLATIDESIEALRKRGEILESDAKKNWDASMVDLDDKRKAAHAKLQEMENATSQAWTDIEKGVQSAWKDLKTAVQKASKQF